MTDFMEVNTADLTGEALNWSVAKALGMDVYLSEPNYGNGPGVMVRYTPDGCHFEQTKRFQPSTEWAQGGPLLETHMRGSGTFCDGLWHHYGVFKCSFENGGWVSEGENPLIVVCRAIVASVLGDTVSVPKELQA